ncbi:hypothetical protein E5S67_04461 [Microcoleus sp. IPMA8]|uniref:Transposase n=1 Tax=Microcoleus asticus IPMA8 TaxID=2563858 RepID=A0ABX2D2B6_9CYAN|nr:hypothetical protein [Microcoleus asticus IPMA8]
MWLRRELPALHKDVGRKSQPAATANLPKSLAIVYLLFVVSSVKSIEYVLRSDRPLKNFTDNCSQKTIDKLIVYGICNHNQDIIKFS